MKKLSIKEKFNNYEGLPQVIAHRGASGIAPENTLAAIEIAQKKGAAWIETDVQITGDRGLIIHHDYELGRTVPGKGTVADLPLRELVSKNAGSWFAKEFSQEKVPTLKQVFDLCADLGLGVNLEVKCRDGGLVMPTVKTLVKFLKGYPRSLSLEISSFNIDFLYYLSRELPELRLGMLIWGISPEVVVTGYWQPIIKEIGGYALHVNRQQASPALVKSVKGLGYKTFVYTADESKEAKKLAAWGVDCICSNYPDRILGSLRKGD